MCKTQKGGRRENHRRRSPGSPRLAEYGRPAACLLVDWTSHGPVRGPWRAAYDLDQDIHNCCRPRISIDECMLHNPRSRTGSGPQQYRLFGRGEPAGPRRWVREQTLGRARSRCGGRSLGPLLTMCADRLPAVAACSPVTGLAVLGGCLPPRPSAILPLAAARPLRCSPINCHRWPKQQNRHQPKLDISGILITRYNPPPPSNSREVHGARRAAVVTWCSTPCQPHGAFHRDHRRAGEPSPPGPPKSGGGPWLPPLPANSIDRFCVDRLPDRPANGHASPRTASCSSGQLLRGPVRSAAALYLSPTAWTVTSGGFSGHRDFNFIPLKRSNNRHHMRSSARFPLRTRVVVLD